MHSVEKELLSRHVVNIVASIENGSSTSLTISESYGGYLSERKLLW